MLDELVRVARASDCSHVRLDFGTGSSGLGQFRPIAAPRRGIELSTALCCSPALVTVQRSAVAAVIRADALSAA